MQAVLPVRVSMIDYNGDAAFRAAGVARRRYPGLLALPNTVLQSGGALWLDLPHGRLALHAELYAVLGRDVALGERGRARDAIAGYGLSLAVWSDFVLGHLERPTMRDTVVTTYYGWYWDGSRIQGPLAADSVPAGLTLTLHLPGCPAAAYPLHDLIWDGGAVLDECSRGMSFRAGEVLCLGPVAPPVAINAADLPAGGVIRLEGGPLGSLHVPVERV